MLAVPLAYKGARFRIRLNQEMINREAILADKFDHLLPRLLEVDNMMLMDRAGAPIPFKIKATTREEKNDFWRIHDRKKMDRVKRMVPAAKNGAQGSPSGNDRGLGKGHLSPGARALRKTTIKTDQ